VRVITRHAAAVTVLAVLAILWSFPLALRLTTHVPGGGYSDNVNFLWNFWWMREALSSGERFFATPYLFAPFGVDLTLHTHTAFNAFVGATALAGASPLTALNLTTLASLILNAVCTYALAWRITRDSGASILAGVVFGGSPYLAAHLNGHFNLTSAWTLPLFALTISNALHPSRGASRWWAAAAGLVLGATVYIDYYYVIYEVAFLLCAVLLSGRDWSITRGQPTPGMLRASRALAILALVDVVVVVAILATGGFETTIGGVRILARDIFNPLQVLWILLGLAALLRWRPRVLWHSGVGPSLPEASAIVATVAVVSMIVALPVLAGGAGVIARGEYVSQRYFWRNAPKGVDLATLILGNPFHGVWGEAVRGSYNWLGIDLIEGGGWLGVAPLVLVGWTLRSHWNDRTVRYWAAVGGLFFIWALGPHLRVLGASTGMILPQTLLRFVPIAANARVPGRAMIVVSLAVAVLGAIAIARSREPLRTRWIGIAAMALIVLMDYAPAPFPMVEVDRPAIYETLRDRPEPGALLELPVGIRDSFVSRGLLDHRALAYQAIHRRPIVGGVVSRLSPSVVNAYTTDPLIDGLLTLSERKPVVHSLPSQAQTAALLQKNGIRFVMLNRNLASRELVEYVEVGMPLTLVASEGERSLYVIRGENDYPR
jgi:hypothetical protein